MRPQELRADMPPSAHAAKFTCVHLRSLLCVPPNTGLGMNEEVRGRAGPGRTGRGTREPIREQPRCAAHQPPWPAVAVRCCTRFFSWGCIYCRWCSSRALRPVPRGAGLSFCRQLDPASLHHVGIMHPGSHVHIT